nr:hypothetical protein [Tanacetum cinerariifolium]
MSTQQDIYVAGFENRPPMLNKENYVPWSSRLLWYAKSRPNGKLIHNSIINGPYVRRMIPEPVLHQDQPSFNQNYMQQPMPNPEDNTDPTTAMNIALALMAKAFNLKYSTPTNNNQRISSNLCNRQITQPGNLNGYNDVQNVENQVIQNAAQNPRVQNVRYQNGLIGVPRNANQNLNGNGNLVAARADGNETGHNGNQIRCYNYRGVGHFARNYTVRPRRRDIAYLHTQLLIAQKEEAGIQLQAEEFDLMAAASDLDEIEEYTELLEPIPESHQVPQNDNNVISEVTSVEHSGETVEQHPANVEETRALYDSLYHSLAIKVEKFNTLKGVKRRRVRDLKGKSKDNSCVSDTLNPLSQKLKNENVELEFQVLNYAKENAHLKNIYKNLFNYISVSRTQTKTIIASLQNKLHNAIYKNAKLRAQLFNKVSDQKDNTRGTSANTKFAKQSITGNLPKVGETHALSKPVTSNSIPTPQESKVMKNDKVIAPGMFRIIPFKTYREEKHVPNTVRASVRTKPITISQPNVFTKKDVNSDSNGLSSTGVDNTKTRRPHHRSNTKNDRVPSASNSSRSKNKKVEVEEHLVCAMCKQCLISVNHNVCLRNYVNGKTSRGKKQKANVSIKEKQKKQQPKVKKTKKVGFIERLATPKPSKPRFLLRWLPTRRMFDLKGYPNLFMVRRLGLFQAHDRKSKASHQFRLEVYGNCSLQK